MKSWGVVTLWPRKAPLTFNGFRRDRENLMLFFFLPGENFIPFSFFSLLPSLSISSCHFSSPRKFLTCAQTFHPPNSFRTRIRITFLFLSLSLYSLFSVVFSKLKLWITSLAKERTKGKQCRGRRDKTSFPSFPERRKAKQTFRPCNIRTWKTWDKRYGGCAVSCRTWAQ